MNWLDNRGETDLNTTEVNSQKINNGVIFCCNNRIPLFLFELVSLTINKTLSTLLVSGLGCCQAFLYCAIKCSVPFFSS